MGTSTFDASQGFQFRNSPQIRISESDTYTGTCFMGAGDIARRWTPAPRTSWSTPTSLGRLDQWERCLGPVVYLMRLWKICQAGFEPSGRKAGHYRLKVTPSGGCNPSEVTSLPGFTRTRVYGDHAYLNRLGRNIASSALVVLRPSRPVIHTPMALCLPGGSDGRGPSSSGGDSCGILRGIANYSCCTAV